MLVVDASVIAPVVADGGPDGVRDRRRIGGEALVAPDLLRVEVLSVLRRHATTGALTPDQADRAVDDLVRLPVTLYPSAVTLRRTWGLRDDVTAYDGGDVALAEELDCPLLTADGRLARAPGPTCTFELL